MANDLKLVASYAESQLPAIDPRRLSSAAPPSSKPSSESDAADPQRRRSDAPHRFLRAIVVVLGIGLSAALALIIHDMLVRDVAARDELARQSLSAALKGKFERELDFFTPIKGLFESSDFVTEVEFRRFTELDSAIRSRQEWLKIAWAPRAPAADEPMPNNSTPYDSAKNAFAIAYAEPAGAKAVLPVGDLGGDTANRAAMTRAAARGGLALTAPTVWVKDGHGTMTMTGFVPIYPGGDRAANKVPVGFIVGFIELDGMVASFLNQNLVYAGFGLQAYDGETPIFSAGPSAAAAPKVPLLIGDRQWQLQIVAPSQQAASVVWLPSLIFLFGLALTGLLYLYFVRSDSEYARVAARVRLATGQLEAANRELESRSERLEALAVDLRRTSEEAQLASAAKTMFLANMSHELRTPLNAVIGFSEVISNQLFGASSPRYADYARDIHSSGEHLLGIIEGLLDMSRVELGMLQIDEKNVRLNAVVEDAMRLTSHRAQEQKVTLRRDGLEALPHITGDARALRQVFINLLTNAIKFSVPHSVVDIGGGMAADGGIVLRVVDRGCGIAPESLEHIFEPFWHSDAHLSHAKDGVGLGLAITRRLVEAHGGEIDVVSETDVGTTVTIHLPASRVIRDAEITELN